MELIEEEKKAIEDSKELINELAKHKDKDFIGRLYYKNKPIEDTLMLLLNIIENQQKETEEKSTIIMAGAEKVKQLEKEIEELKSIASEFTNRNIEQFSIGEFNFKVKHFKDNYIHKDKIRELKEKVEKEMINNPYDFSYMINELLEEN